MALVVNTSASLQFVLTLNLHIHRSLGKPWNQIKRYNRGFLLPRLEYQIILSVLLINLYSCSLTCFEFCSGKTTRRRPWTCGWCWILSAVIKGVHWDHRSSFLGYSWKYILESLDMNMPVPIVISYNSSLLLVLKNSSVKSLLVF